MKKVCLNGNWKLRHAPISWGADKLMDVMASEEAVVKENSKCFPRQADLEQWLDCNVPCDIHTPLEQAGIIGDVVKSDNCYAAEWTEKVSWWFVKRFDGNDIDPEAEAVPKYR